MRKMRLRINLLAIAATLLLAAVLMAVLARPLAVAVYAARNSLKISYSSLTGGGRTVVFGNLTVTSAKYGLGLESGKAALRSDWVKGLLGPGPVDFDFENVRFVKGAGIAGGRYDDLMSLAAAPFDARWSYSKISGRYIPSNNGFIMEGLEALGDDIRLRAGRISLAGSEIDADCEISFSPAALTAIPHELAETLLKEEASGWRGMEIRLKGDYAAPAVELSGNLFRLNVRAISGETE